MIWSRGSAVAIALLASLVAGLSIPVSISATIPALSTISTAQLANSQNILTLKAGATDSDIQKIKNLLGANNILQNLDFSGLIILVTQAISPSLLALVEALGIVNTIEPNYLLQPFALYSQGNVPHGLDQVSHRSPDQNSYSYIYDDSLGQNTCAYIIDTGVQRNHPELNGRSFSPIYCAGSSGCVTNSNTNGSPYGDHGTLIAGALVGSYVGVARKAKYMDLQLFSSDSNSGSMSNALSALQVAYAHYQATRNSDCKSGATINMSFGYQGLGTDQANAISSAISKATQSGMFVVAAAGNSNADAGNFVPARLSNTCTVGSVDTTNKKASFSNYGSSVDMWAPGTGVMSSNANSGYSSVDGTSVSSPAIAGLGMYLQSYCGSKTGRTKSPSDLCSYLQRTGNSFSLNVGGVGTGYVGFNGANVALCSGW